MVVNIWRYGHFALAISSCLFVFLAAFSGIILALEPIESKLRPYKINGMEGQNLSTTIEVLKNTYDEVLEINIDQNDFVSVSAISMDDDLGGDFYVDPITGRKLGNIEPQTPFFAFVTNLHRSLFLKTLGRIFVGIGSFFLFLIVVTGGILVIKRQKGFRKFFSRIIKEDFAQYWHVVLGRWSLVPIFVLALTGVYLSLLRFEIIPSPQPRSSLDLDKISEPAVPVPIIEFPIFKDTELREVRSLEFPFSDDPSDFFILNLKDRELKIHQRTGEVVETLHYPFINRMSDLSFNLHTGSGSIVWSLVLLIAACNILFFIYSGGLISYKRLKSKIRNKYGPNDAEYIILVGSENGSTRHLGNLLQQSLLKIGQRVFMDDLNHVQQYGNMKHLVVITSTYGDGDPPANATHFLERAHILSKGKFNYAVVGLGSLAYEHFCGFALKVDLFLRQTQGISALQDPFLIHNRSYTSFQKWLHKWGDQVGLPVKLPPKKENNNHNLKKFKVIAKNVLDDGFDQTFTLRLRPRSKQKFRSGDLLAFYPSEDPIKREYSIGKICGGDILLSIKLHPKGICSNYLYKLDDGDVIKAELIANKRFHCPENGKPVIMVANGTGIAPFLGMLGGPNEKCMYWGGKSELSFQLYKPFFEDVKAQNGTIGFKTVFSRENGEMKYVQELVEKDVGPILEVLDKGGTLMICGSVQMQNGVLLILGQLCEQQGKHLNGYQTNGQLLMDCY